MCRARNSCIDCDEEQFRRLPVISLERGLWVYSNLENLAGQRLVIIVEPVRESKRNPFTNLDAADVPATLECSNKGPIVFDALEDQAVNEPLKVGSRVEAMGSCDGCLQEEAAAAARLEARRGEHGECRWGGESGSSDGSVGGVVDTISHHHGPRHDSRQQLPLPRANPGWEFIS